MTLYFEGFDLAPDMDSGAAAEWASDETQTAIESPEPAVASTACEKPGFDSFWMAAFEGADHVSAQDVPLSMQRLTQHDSLAEQDYAGLKQFGLRVIRESVGWRLSERPDGRYDFTHIEGHARIAAAQGLQVIWTLLHYGFPRDLSPLDPSFVRRFARFSRAAAIHLARFSVAPPVFVPIQEISYLAWALCETGIFGRNDHLSGRGEEVRRQLVRASIAACEAIREVDPRARFMHTDPLVYVSVAEARADACSEAARQFELQFRTWDMLCGRVEPDLGGDPRYLDVVGLNYFPGNQWELSSGKILDWHTRDPRRASLADLLERVHLRYQLPLVIAETGHRGVGCGPWIRDVAAEVRDAIRRGVAVEGICLYQVIDSPDWNNTSRWHGSGLWSTPPATADACERRLNAAYAASLVAAQQDLGRNSLKRRARSQASSRLLPKARNFIPNAAVRMAHGFPLAAPLDAR